MAPLRWRRSQFFSLIWMNAIIYTQLMEETTASITWDLPKSSHVPFPLRLATNWRLFKFSIWRFLKLLFSEAWTISANAMRRNFTIKHVYTKGTVFDKYFSQENLHKGFPIFDCLRYRIHSQNQPVDTSVISSNSVNLRLFLVLRRKQIVQTGHPHNLHQGKKRIVVCLPLYVPWQHGKKRMCYGRFRYIEIVLKWVYEP